MCDEIPQALALSDADREYIASWQSPRAATPSEIEIRHRLGPYAADKLRLFLGMGPSVKTYTTGCHGCGISIDESQTTHCPACQPEHARRSAERQAAAERQNQRERALLNGLRSRP